jgi:pyridoxal phosphate enzyme (YggS family)
VTLLSYADFQLRADGVRARLAAACARAGRHPASVELLAVTKTLPAAAAEYVARYGLRGVGENRVQEGIEKRAQTSAPLRWELIGHLQSNKAGSAAENFDRIQTVDSAKLLLQLDRAAAASGRPLAILLQVNAGDDPAKFGVTVAEAPRLLEAALALPSLRVEGLMTVAPLSGDPAVAERAFARLRAARDQLAHQFQTPLAVLSMGMSGDLEAAVAAGSTVVRVGSALFGARA